MLHELEDPSGRTSTELHERYLEALLAVIDEHGVDTLGEAGVDPEKLRELSNGGDPELTLEEAASILAVKSETPDADTIAAIARDELLMGMTAAVLDVEAVESGLEGKLEAREIQAKIEGRFPMSLREFALLYVYIDGKR